MAAIHFGTCSTAQAPLCAVMVSSFSDAIVLPGLEPESERKVAENQ